MFIKLYFKSIHPCGNGMAHTEAKSLRIHGSHSIDSHIDRFSGEAFSLFASVTTAFRFENTVDFFLRLD